MGLSKLLDTASYRRLQLLELLILDDAWITLDTLSEQLCCSRRTLIADIQMINKRSEDYFHIKTSKQRGVKLISSDLFHMEDVYRDLMQESLNFQIIKEVIESNAITKEVLVEKLFISPSSLNRNLKQINLLLAEYELEIQTNPIKITGKEEQIRFFYTIFLNEMYSYDIDRFQHPLKNIVVQFLEQLEKENESHPYSFITRHRIIVWLTVCAERITKGYLIEKGYPLPNTLSPDRKTVLNNLVRQLPFEPPEKEISFLIYIYSNNHREIGEIELIKDSPLQSVYQEITFLVEEIKKETSYTIDNQTHLINNLMGYFFYHNFFKGPSNLLVSPEKKLFGLTLKLFNEFSMIVTKIVKKYPIDNWLDESQIGEFTLILILCWRGLVNQVILKKEKIDVLIVSYIGIQQELFLCDMLHASYPNSINCQPASEKESFEKNYQIVLTDHSVNWIKEKMSTSKKVIGINMIPTKRDWKRIEATIKLFE